MEIRKKRITVNHILLWLLIFSTAMGILEGIVVVYLREIYYPSGFTFPMSLLSKQMMTIEWVREAATIIMLVSVSIVAGKNNLQRFAFFLFNFAVWDIIYYLTLKACLGWPPSLLTWDILFLIPVPWLGPVLAPVICSLSMIALSLGILIRQKKDYHFRMMPREWWILVGGSVIILLTFMGDFLKLIFQSGNSGSSHSEKVMQAITHFVPVSFNWYVFALGIVTIWVAIVMILRHTNKGRPRY